MPNRAFPAVVIGASAGGVEALLQVIGGIPTPMPAAVLVVLHIPAHVKSDLARILQQVTALPVSDAKNGQQLEAGHIYVATPDRHLLITRTSMRLTHAPKESRSRPAIDALFRSAAAAFGPLVIGVVLSGMLDDGTSGLWAIKDQGGVALVQGDAPEMYASMPESAALQVDVDAVASAQQLGALIGIYVSRLVADLSSAPSGAWAVPAANELPASKRASSASAMRTMAITPRTCPVCVARATDNRAGSSIRVPIEFTPASSMRALLLDVDDAIDKGLRDALRAIDERVLMLRQMARTAEKAGSETVAEEYFVRADDAVTWSEALRQMATSMRSDTYGH